MLKIPDTLNKYLYNAFNGINEDSIKEMNCLIKQSNPNIPIKLNTTNLKYLLIVFGIWVYFIPYHRVNFINSFIGNSIMNNIG